MSDLSYWTSLTMLVCHHHRAEHGAVPGGGSSGGVVMKQNASLINVSMWHYSGLYPPPFRIGFHTGRGRVVGISLNKHLSSVLPVCVSVWSVPWTNQFQLQGPHNGTCPPPQSPPHPRQGLASSCQTVVCVGYFCLSDCSRRPHWSHDQQLKTKTLESEKSKWELTFLRPPPHPPQP